MIMKSCLLKFVGTSRIYIENGEVYILSHNKPESLNHREVTIFNYTYPPTAWAELANKTVIYFKRRIEADECDIVSCVQMPIGKEIVFSSLSFVNDENQQCEYQFAFIDNQCIVYSRVLDESNEATILNFAEKWRQSIIEQCCTLS
jgi:hypothetical protein